MHQTRVAARRLRSTLREFDDVVDADPAEELNSELAWYAELLGQVRARKVLASELTAVKRARYAAELVEPANAEMKQIAQDAKEMQTLLGEHQDSVVAAEFLARMSSADNVAAGESVFTYVSL